MTFVLQILQGALIGLGSVLPGISGGVLSVVFGVYKPMMELLANPARCLRTHLKLLAPYLLGMVLGFMGVANLLSFFLEKYPDPSVCLFVGLIIGMIPSLFREAGEQGRPKSAWLSLGFSMAFTFTLLLGLRALSVTIMPSFSWFVFCGFSLALSIIAPGMSFSTVLMPLGLYTPFVDGIGHLHLSVLLPAGIGGALTMLFLPKLVNRLFERHYPAAFHAILGIVIAATVMIVPFKSFQITITGSLINIFFIAAGVFIASLFDCKKRPI